ncbi:MAG: hypothetical protein WCW31_05875 [Patescibacteria group bacterium]|jgi:hypothetical protein
MNTFIKTRFFVLFFLPLIAVLADCNEPSSDDVQRRQQEQILMEGTAQIGMPAVKNFRERRLLKMILELRDQNDVSTFTYLWSDYQGKWVFFCHSIGYGIPYATQYTNPQKVDCNTSRCATLPQADPNGLFSPASAEGTWVMCKDPKGPDVKPVYIEPRSIVSPFELPDSAVTPVATPRVPSTEAPKPDKK